MGPIFIFIGILIFIFILVALIAKSFQKGTAPSQPRIISNKKQTDTWSSAIVKFLLILAAIWGVFLFFSYGTLDPCGILKKEIAMQIQREGDEAQGMYALFGGFVERTIDGMTPLQCIQKAIEVRRDGYEKAFSDMEQSETSGAPKRVPDVPTLPASR